MGLRDRSENRGETHAGETVSFSDEAYADAMERYSLKDIEDVVRRLEADLWVQPGTAEFFRDFAIIQEEKHPDFDRGNAIGSLATRIEIATGEITTDELDRSDINYMAARAEYDLVFG